MLRDVDHGSPLAPRVVRVDLQPRRFAPRIAAPPEPRGRPAQALAGTARSVTHVPGQKCYPCSRLHRAGPVRSGSHGRSIPVPNHPSQIAVQLYVQVLVPTNPLPAATSNAVVGTIGQ